MWKFESINIISVVFLYVISLTFFSYPPWLKLFIFASLNNISSIGNHGYFTHVVSVFHHDI